jgi:hypothetical protein
MDKKPWTHILTIVIYSVLAAVILVHACFFRNYITACLTLAWIVSTVIVELKKYKKKAVSQKLSFFSRIIFHVTIVTSYIETGVNVARMLK